MTEFFPAAWKSAARVAVMVNEGSSTEIARMSPFADGAIPWAVSA
jgi:hypothetical protein